MSYLVNQFGTSQGTNRFGTDQGTNRFASMIQIRGSRSQWERLIHELQSEKLLITIMRLEVWLISSF